MLPRFKLQIGCCSFINTKRSGKVLQVLVAIFNLIFLLVGWAIIGVAVWLMAVELFIKSSFIDVQTLKTAVIIFLVVGVFLMLTSFIGTCAVYQKSRTLLRIAILIMFFLVIAEPVGLVLFVQSQNQILFDTKQWYTEVFISQINDTKNATIIRHVESALKCCGLFQNSDYKHTLKTNHFPESCKDDFVNLGSISIWPVYTTGCLKKFEDILIWILKSWQLWLGVSIVLCLEICGFISELLYLIYLIRRGNFDYLEDSDEEDELHEDSELINSVDSMTKQGSSRFGKSIAFFKDLPLPKLYRVVRNAQTSDFGIHVNFDDVRNCHVIMNVDSKSNADFAGITSGSKVIELNGVMARYATLEEIEFSIAMARNELRLLLADAETCSLYRDHKVSINLKNLEGITKSELKYQPRLCKVKKSQVGYGFSIFYLEDRVGEYIENLMPNGPGHRAGLKVGDRIIEVNGVNVEKEKSIEVVKRIRKSSSEVDLLVVDSKTDGYFRKKAICVTASLAFDYFAQYEADLSHSITAVPLEALSDVSPRYCRLLRRPREEYGLYVVVDNKRMGLVIRWVDCGGAADRCGLRIGDRIVEVNDQNVEYESHERLVEMIKQNKTATDLIVVDEDYDRIYDRKEPRISRICKEHNGFGFHFYFSSSKNGIYVRKIQENGQAEKAGLKVGDRIIHVNDQSIENHDEEEVAIFFNSCGEVLKLLVMDKVSSKHYKRIVEFKKLSAKQIDYDAISIPEEPVFLLQDQDSDTDSYVTRTSTMSLFDSISMAETRSYSSATLSSRNGLSAATRHCVLHKDENDGYGFFLATDRNRNGQVIRSVVKDGAADRAGLINEDRIICINDEKVENMNHEQIMSRISESGNTIIFTVVDEESDHFGFQKRPYLFRIQKSKSGYGFYLWYDEDGHYVEDVTIGSPADKAGLRGGDRLVEITGVNVEQETHEDVFYRIKACENVVTLLAVDAKTFSHCKKNGVDICARKEGTTEAADENFEINFMQPNKRRPQNGSKMARHELVLTKQTKEVDYGFNLAYSNSFMEPMEKQGGHIVHWVDKKGPAGMGGLRDGDRVIEVNDVNVENEDHEHVMIRIHGNGRNAVKLLVEYEEGNEAFHEVEVFMEESTFGFYLWFDGLGHYIEDVTFNSNADKTGLEVGDRLIEVNGKNVENSSHEDVVSFVKGSGHCVRLKVMRSSGNGTINDVKPQTCNMIKLDGAFGFWIAEDENGLYIEDVLPSSAAQMAGLHIGDRILKINGTSVEDVSKIEAIESIKLSGDILKLETLSAKREELKSKRISNGLKFSHFPAIEENICAVNPIFQQLFEKEKFDCVVVTEDCATKKERIKSATDLNRLKTTNKEYKEKNAKNNHKRKQNRLKRMGSCKRKQPTHSGLVKKEKKKHLKLAQYSKNNEDIAFVEEETDGTRKTSSLNQRPTNKRSKKLRKEFHFPTDKQLKWKFDETKPFTFASENSAQHSPTNHVSKLTSHSPDPVYPGSDQNDIFHLGAWSSQ